MNLGIWNCLMSMLTRVTSAGNWMWIRSSLTSSSTTPSNVPPSWAPRPTETASAVRGWRCFGLSGGAAEVEWRLSGGLKLKHSFSGGRLEEPMDCTKFRGAAGQQLLVNSSKTFWCFPGNSPCTSYQGSTLHPNTQ